MGIEEEAVDKDDGEFEDVLTWTRYKTLWSVSPLSAIDLYLFLPNLNYIHRFDGGSSIKALENCKYARRRRCTAAISIPLLTQHLLDDGMEWSEILVGTYIYP